MINLDQDYFHAKNRVTNSQLDLNSLTFPDILAHFSLTFPDFRQIELWWVSREILSEARKVFAPATIGFLHKYA